MQRVVFRSHIHDCNLVDKEGRPFTASASRLLHLERDDADQLQPTGLSTDLLTKVDYFVEIRRRQPCDEERLSEHSQRAAL